MNQLPLFPPSQPTPTSIEAAESIQLSAETLRAQALAYIRARGADGATDDEVQHAMNMNGSTERPRRCELVARGLIRDSGRVRKTRSGRAAIVWTLK